MTDKPLAIIRANREAIYTAYSARLQQVGPHNAAASEETLRGSFAGILEALAGYWERHDEAKARTWAETQAQLSVSQGGSVLEIVGGLDLLAELIRPYLEECCQRRSALLAALKQLDGGLSLLRRCYLEAHLARHRETQPQSGHLDALSSPSTEGKPAEKLFQRLFEIAPEAIVIVSQDGKIVLFNTATETLFGYRPEELLGQSIEMLMSERFRAKHAEYRADYVAAPRMRPMGLGLDLIGRCKDGREFPAEISLCPIETEAGLLVATRICDITGRNWLHERLQRQERLAAVGQLAAGVAHDFNNLLTGIIGFADMLQKRADMPEHARARLARIVTQGERGAHLVRQILDFSRASISQLQPLDLADFLKRATSFLEYTVSENIHIVLEIDPGTHHVRADPDRLRQVLTNLAMNARDAMPEGGTLTFRLSGFTRQLNERPPCPGMPPGEWVLLSVSDTGTGIPAEVLPHVFEPFFTTKAPGKGTGLGLAQVHGIIEQHEGYMHAESQEGEGTMVAIYLPFLGVGKGERMGYRSANSQDRDESPTA